MGVPHAPHFGPSAALSARIRFHLPQCAQRSVSRGALVVCVVAIVASRSGRRWLSSLLQVSGALAQLGERLVCNQEVAGSIPVRSTRCCLVAPECTTGALIVGERRSCGSCGSTPIASCATHTVSRVSKEFLGVARRVGVRIGAPLFGAA